MPEKLLKPQGQRGHEFRKLLFRALGHGVTSRVKIPSEARIGMAARDAPAVRCVHLADECSIAHVAMMGSLGLIPRTPSGSPVSYCYVAADDGERLAAIVLGMIWEYAGDGKGQIGSL